MGLIQTILFSTYYNTLAHREISHALFYILSQGYSVDVITNGHQSESLLLTETLVNNRYDIIFAFTRKGFQRIKRYAQENHIPVVYVVCRQESEKEFILDFPIARFLVINDESEFNPILFSDNFTFTIDYPFVIEGNLPMNKIVADAPILIVTDERTLLKVIPVLNNHGEYQFTIVCDHPRSIRALLNANCEAMNTAGCNLEKQIQQSSLILGNGVTILKSIAYHKPAIVVGKFGLGRRVNMDNIEWHYNTLFRGRPGAVGDEIIPFNLLSYEIVSCMNQSASDKQSECSQLFGWIAEKQQQITERIDKIIDQTICPVAIDETTYQLSSIYSFIATDNDSYFVIDRRWMKIEAMIDSADYHLLQLFKSGATLNSIRPHVTHKTSQQLDKFMQYLIVHKFIFPHAKSTDL